MSTLRRFVYEESGMTMGLAIIMIVLLSVMGAGLLTFVSRDLHTVVEENRGQRAFEVADAGIAAAKRQLLSDCGEDTDCKDHYDDVAGAVVGTQDIQWSAAEDGLTLTNLDGVSGTIDCANVRISATDTYEFRVISTGTYGGTGTCEGAVPVTHAKRKIEAKLQGIGGGPGEGPIVNPGFYTPSDIMIDGIITMSGQSLFTEKNIVIKGLDLTSNPNPRKAFQDDFATPSGGIFRGPEQPDPLGNWDSRNLAGEKTWNIVPRTRRVGPNLQPYTRLGLAAQGRICVSTLTCTNSNPSVADGVYGYDITTGVDTIDPNLTSPALQSNLKKFGVKDPPCSITACPTPTATQDPNMITYPFPRVKPDPARLLNLAETHESGNSKYYSCPAAAPAGCSPPWTTGATPLLDPMGDSDKVIFIDARGNDIAFNNGNANYKGIIVVWCGHLTMMSKFQGIIISLYGNSFDDSISTCGNDRGRFTVAANNKDFSGWAYANGGTGTTTAGGTPGIQFGNNSSVNAFPGGADIANVAFGVESTGPGDFVVQDWRELYE